MVFRQSHLKTRVGTSRFFVKSELLSHLEQRLRVAHKLVDVPLTCNRKKPVFPRMLYDKTRLCKTGTLARHGFLDNFLILQSAGFTYILARKIFEYLNI